MPKWKKGATEFVVSVSRNTQRGTSFSYIPKPLLERLGNPAALRFSIQKGRIVMTKAPPKGG